MNSNLKISIITPNYNYANYIDKTIESIVNQDYKNIEYIIVDDGSTDNSVELIQQYVSKHPNKITLIQQENRGQSAAVNVGLRKASGDIIGWINSDDTFCKNTFSRVAQMFNKKPDSDIVFGDINIMDLKGNFIYQKRHLKFNYLTGCFLSFASIMNSNSVFWKKETMHKSELLNENFSCNMDGEFFSRLCNGMKVSKINKPLANFRKQPHIKASEKIINWNKIVRKEALLELSNSYKQLSLSKYIPYKYTKIIRLFVLIRRIVFRMVKMHYVIQFFEITKYKIKKPTNMLIKFIKKVLRNSMLFYHIKKLVILFRYRKKKGKAINYVFTEIYNLNEWDSNESVSGKGSQISETKAIRNTLPDIINKYKINTFLDIPCGDFNWLKNVDLAVEKYIGGDIVKEIINKNRKLYLKKNRDFILIDLTVDNLPKSDILFCRDLLVHFSYNDIKKAIGNIKKNEIKYLLTTTFTNEKRNINIPTGAWRPINLQKEPFNFPKPILFINEQPFGVKNEKHKDKCMALWSVDELPN